MTKWTKKRPQNIKQSTNYTSKIETLTKVTTSMIKLVTKTGTEIFFHFFGDLVTFFDDLITFFKI